MLKIGISLIIIHLCTSFSQNYTQRSKCPIPSANGLIMLKHTGALLPFPGERVSSFLTARYAK